jgi:phosphoglycerol transferase MdoB-like AlkP superfamily enzyme
MLTYWFWPNPGNASYSDPKVLGLIALCALLFFGSFAVSVWRKRAGNPLTKKLARSWPSAMQWFGCLGVLLIVARVEEIQWLAMRFLWAVWMFSAVLFIGLQLWIFRKRHYTVVPREKRSDPRSMYLPQ